MESTESIDLAREAVTRGVALLDQHGPEGWRDRIDREALDIAASIDFMIMGCQAFHQCPSMAVTVIDHSVFGQVPACQRCAGILS